MSVGLAQLGWPKLLPGGIQRSGLFAWSQVSLLPPGSFPTSSGLDTGLPQPITAGWYGASVPDPASLWHLW